MRCLVGRCCADGVVRGEVEQADLGIGEDLAGDEAVERGAEPFGAPRGGTGAEGAADVLARIGAVAVRPLVPPILTDSGPTL